VANSTVKNGQGFTGEIIHFHVVRMRVTGSGNLDLELHSLDDVNVVALTSVPMSTATNREPTVLANFREQRAQLRFSVNAINEYFNLSKIVIFMKPDATGYPQ
jgi:hypothetical protein